ncbi:MAG: calcium/proton exchanger [Planctomycetia bacterium]|nr:calcium/proton exchanger [Planctomycetia bacterium]
MRWLLLSVPAMFVLKWIDGDPLLVFALSLVAVIPLVEEMGDATERLAVRLGPTIGGLLNSTLSNAPELIIGGVGLANGLAPVVKASLTGSILVNLLVGLGCALVVGGIKFGARRFERKRLRASVAMLMLCAACLIVPAVFRFSQPESNRGLSTEIAVVLLVVYVINVLATVFGRGTEGIGPDEQLPETFPEERAWITLARLALSAVALAIVSDALSESLAPTARQLGLSDVFSGVILLGGVGGIGEVLAAIRFARSGRQELVLAVTVGSTIQLTLLVAPLLVLAGRVIGEPMNLAFSGFEVVALVIAVLVARELIDGGKVSWMEGVLLLALYAIFLLAFYHLPDQAVVDAMPA